jgi:hypothetical protein
LTAPLPSRWQSTKSVVGARGKKKTRGKKKKRRKGSGSHQKGSGESTAAASFPFHIPFSPKPAQKDRGFPSRRPLSPLRPLLPLTATTPWRRSEGHRALQLRSADPSSSLALGPPDLGARRSPVPGSGRDLSFRVLFLRAYKTSLSLSLYLSLSLGFLGLFSIRPQIPPVI